MVINRVLDKNIKQKSFFPRLFPYLMLIFTLFSLLPTTSSAVTPRHIILMITDGCGIKHIEATNAYTGSVPAYQTDSNWVKHWVSTYPSGGSYNGSSYWDTNFNYVLSGAITDSAGSSTAMYTGNKTANLRVCVSSSGNIRFLNIGEVAKDNCIASGAISTVPVSHATVGTWIAHNSSRRNRYALADEGLFEDPNTTGTGGRYSGGFGPTIPRTDVVIGDGFNSAYTNTAIRNKLSNESGDLGKHTLVKWLSSQDGGVNLINASNNPNVTRLAGLFKHVYRKANFTGTDTQNPTLAESTTAALNVLSRNPNGFVLMIEGGAVDWAGHTNIMDDMIGEQRDFDAAVQAVIDFINSTPGVTWNNTLVIVTSDHECGYLTAGLNVYPKDSNPITTVNSNTLSKEKVYTNIAGNVRASWEDTSTNPPNNRIDNGERVYWVWHTRGHSNSLVPLYARGVGASQFAIHATGSDPERGPYLDNTSVFAVMNNVLRSDSRTTLNVNKPNGDTVTVGDTFNIQYTLTDIDNIATVDFYRDNNNSGFNGTLISTGSPEGTNRTTGWDTTGMTPGQYYIYGVTNIDGITNNLTCDPVYDYSPGHITINSGNSGESNTLTVQPSSADSYMRDGTLSSNNHGAQSSIWLKNGVTGFQRRGILGFDFSALDDTTIIESAYLDLFYYNNSIGDDPVGETVEVNRLTQTGWIEGEVTWDNYKNGTPWTTGGGDFATIDQATAVMPSAFGWVRWTVTDQIKYAQSNTSEVAHMLIKFATTTPNIGARFYSKEFATDPSKRPRLIINNSTGTGNTPPMLSITEPDGTVDVVTVGDLYNVKYNLIDPDDAVTVALFYDTDNAGFNGTAIGSCSAAPEGSGVTCSWNTTGITPGSYYVYGVTNDGRNPDVKAYSPGSITINSGGSSTLTVQPSSADSYMRDGTLSSNNHGAQTSIWLKNSIVSYNRRGILGFDFSELDDSVVIESAYLDLYYYNNSIGDDPVGETVEVNRLTQTGWVEGEVTWNNYKNGTPWTTGGGDFATVDQATAIMPSAFGWVRWTVTDQIKYAQSNTSEVAHMLIKFATTTPNIGARFYSKEFATDPSKRPRIIINYATVSSTLTVQPSSADSYMRDGTLSSNNHGAQSSIWLKNSIVSYNRRGILGFDFSVLDDTAIIESAYLDLYYYNNSIGDDPVGETVEVNRLTQTGWVEGEVTWDNYKNGTPWTTGGGDFATVDQATAVMPSAFGWVRWTVTDQIKYAQSNTSEVAHMLIKFATTTPNIGARFYSKEFATDPSKRPRIIINYSTP